MTTAATSIDPAFDTSVRALARRNAPVDVTPIVDRQAPRGAQVQRLRVLDVTAAGILLELPRSRAARDALAVETQVHVLLIDQEQRWQFYSTVVDTGRVKLNALLEVPAIVLAWPLQVRQAQRRKFFRIATADTPLPPAQLSLLDEDTGAPVGDEPITTTLVNISGGGLGLHVDAALAFELRRGTYLSCRLDLPGVGPIELPTRVIHTRDVNRRTVYLGLKWDTHATVALDRICRFIAQRQRTVLQQRSVGK